MEKIIAATLQKLPTPNSSVRTGYTHFDQHWSRKTVSMKNASKIMLSFFQKQVK